MPIKPPLQFRTVQLGSARQPNEGLRIGAVRFLPRGVPKVEYQARNLFDVWLPTLAPSRPLLRALKTQLQLPAFFSRYRNEMAETEPRQVIQLLAELARTAPISLGCYCEQEARCHRSVLGELIREAAGEPAMRPISDKCVYTITHPEKLSRIEGDENGSGVLSEKKRWANGLNLWHEAQQYGQALPIVFADSTDCSRLIYWGLLGSITIDDEGTRYSFSQLKRIAGKHSPQELILLNSGERIADKLIRPYALVQTPIFIH